MAYKWRINTGSGMNVIGNIVHLSDGTAIMLELNSTTSAWRVHYTTGDRSTLTAIATLPAAASSGDLAMDLAVDSADNIYVFGVAEIPGVGNTWSVQALTKGAGLTWTLQTRLMGSVSEGPTGITGLRGTWCGTGGSGHLLMAWTRAGSPYTSRYAIFSATTVLSGTGNPLTEGPVTSPAFLGGAADPSSGVVEIANDGRGATTGLSAIKSASSSVALGKWSVTAAGLLGTSGLVATLATYAYGEGQFTRVRLLRYGADAFAVVYASPTLHQYRIARYSSAGVITAPVDSGDPPGMLMRGGNRTDWDAILDVGEAEVRIVASNVGAANSGRFVYRLDCSIGSGVVWDTAGITEDSDMGDGSFRSQKITSVNVPLSAGSTQDYVVNGDDTAAYRLAGSYLTTTLEIRGWQIGSIRIGGLPLPPPGGPQLRAAYSSALVYDTSFRVKFPATAIVGDLVVMWHRHDNNNGGQITGNPLDSPWNNSTYLGTGGPSGPGSTTYLEWKILKPSDFAADRPRDADGDLYWHLTNQTQGGQFSSGGAALCVAVMKGTFKAASPIAGASSFIDSRGVYPTEQALPATGDIFAIVPSITPSQSPSKLLSFVDNNYLVPGVLSGNPAGGFDILPADVQMWETHDFGYLALYETYEEAALPTGERRVRDLTRKAWPMAHGLLIAGGP